MSVTQYRYAALHAFRNRHVSPAARRAAENMVARAVSNRNALRSLGVEA